MCFFGSGGTHLAGVSLILVAVGVLWNLTLHSSLGGMNIYITYFKSD